MGHVARQNEGGVGDVLDCVEHALEAVYHMQLLHFEASQFFDTAAFRLRLVVGLEKAHDGACKVLLLQIDQTCVELELEGVKLAFELVEYFLALVSYRVLIGSTGGHVGANVIHLVANVAVKLTVWSAKEVHSLLEVAQLVMHLG